MVVGLTESVTIIALNSLTVIAFCRGRNLRKRSTYLVISLAVADMLSGGTSTLDFFYNVGAMCNFWRHNPEHWYQIAVVLVLVLWFTLCSLTNMTVISLERLNATFWPFRHRSIKKSVYWVVIIAIWLAALLFSCFSSFLSLCLDSLHVFYSFAGFRFCQRCKYKHVRHCDCNFNQIVQFSIIILCKYPKVNMHILRTVLDIFPMDLTRRICETIKGS